MSVKGDSMKEESMNGKPIAQGEPIVVSPLPPTPPTTPPTPPKRKAFKVRLLQDRYLENGTNGMFKAGSIFAINDHPQATQWARELTTHNGKRLAELVEVDI
jgi:hypothetical protein